MSVQRLVKNVLRVRRAKGKAQAATAVLREGYDPETGIQPLPGTAATDALKRVVTKRKTVTVAKPLRQK